MLVALIEAMLRLTAFVFVLLCARSALACSCLPGVPDVCEVLYTATAVFYGKATSVDSEKTTFVVEKWLHGKAPRKTIAINRFSDCDVDFTVGRRYVVYAYAGEEGGFVTFRCGRSGGYSELPAAGADDIAYATNPPRRNHAVVDGRVRYYAPGNARPPATVRVVGKDLAMPVDAEGRFHFDLPPGRYELIAEAAGLPSTHPIEINLPVAAACARPTLTLENDGRIGGTIRFTDGSPVGRVMVTLLRVGRGPLDHGTSRRTGSDGRYEFTGLSTGKYVVGISVGELWRPSPDNPHATQFYPSAADEAHAKPIELADRAVLGNIDLVVPPPRPTCRVEFRVRDLTGKRAQATLKITGPGVPIARLLSMTSDPFLRVFTDVDMNIEVCATRPDPPPCARQTRRFTEDAIVELPLPML